MLHTPFVSEKILSQTHDKQTDPPFPHTWVLRAFTVMGFVMGFLAGVSTTPVAGSLLSGILGGVGAVAALMFVKKKEDLGIQILHKGTIAKGVLCFAIALIPGVVFGTELRTHELFTFAFGDKLLSVTKAAEMRKVKLTAKQEVLLLLIQRILSDKAVPISASNSAITKLIDSAGERESVVSLRPNNSTVEYLQNRFQKAARQQRTVNELGKALENMELYLSRLSSQKGLDDNLYTAVDNALVAVKSLRDEIRPNPIVAEDEVDYETLAKVLAPEIDAVFEHCQSIASSGELPKNSILMSEVKDPLAEGDGDTEKKKKVE